MLEYQAVCDSHVPITFTWVTTVVLSHATKRGRTQRTSLRTWQASSQILSPQHHDQYQQQQLDQGYSTSSDLFRFHRQAETITEHATLDYCDLKTTPVLQLHKSDEKHIQNVSFNYCLVDETNVNKLDPHPEEACPVGLTNLVTCV